MRITRKLLVPTLIFVSLIIAGLITYNTLVSVRQNNEAEQGRLENMSEVFQARIKAREDLAVALASDVANNPEVQAAFAAKDRERLIELTLPAYEVLDARFDIPQFQFHLPPATSFLRLHNLEQYGDDLSSFRFTVLAANAENRVVSGPEIGRGGLGIRGVVPVSYQGRHIGTVEFGTNVDLTLIEELKNEFGYDMQILLSRGPAEVATFQGATGESQGPIDELLFQAGTLSTPTFASTTNYTQALAGNASIENVTAGKLEYAVYSTPLYDYSGNVIGVVDIISDRTVIAQQHNAQILLSIGILLAALLVIGLGFAFLAGRTLRPIGELTSVASSIAAGDFSKRTNVKSDDELGTLAQAFDTMTAQLRESIGNLEQRVKERTEALSSVAEISTAVSTILDTDELLQHVVDLAKNNFGFYHAHIYLLDETGTSLVLSAGAGDTGKQMVADGHAIPLDREQSLVARAAREKKGVTINDVTIEPGFLPNRLLPNTHSELAVPMMVGDKVIGVFDVQSEAVGRFTDSDIAVQITLASQVASAVQNARTYSEVQHSQEQLAEALSISGLANWEYDVYQDIFTFNDHFYSIFRTSVEKVGGYHLSSADYARLFVHPEDAALVGAEIQRVIESKERRFTTALEHRIIFSNGEVGYISVKINVERDENGKIIRWSGANQDVTERRLLENLNRKRATQQEAINLITQKIQNASTVEDALQVAARELGHALGNRQTLVALDTSALSGGNRTQVATEETE